MCTSVLSERVLKSAYLLPQGRVMYTPDTLANSQGTPSKNFSRTSDTVKHLNVFRIFSKGNVSFTSYPMLMIC